MKHVAKVVDAVVATAAVVAIMIMTILSLLLCACAYHQCPRTAVSMVVLSMLVVFAAASVACVFACSLDAVPIQPH